MEYAIKATQKKIQTIEGHVQLHEKISRMTRSQKKRQLDEDVAPEKTLRMAPFEISN